MSKERDSVFEVPDLTKIKEITIRGKIPIETSVFRQIERCNIALSNPDPNVFNSNVRALMYMLPSHMREKVEAQGEKYNKNETRWVFKYCCGNKMGTPEEPLMDDEGNIISPIPKEIEYTDYEILLGLVIKAFEDLGLTWRTEKSGYEVGEIIDERVTEEVTTMAENKVVEALMEARKRHPGLTFQMIVEKLRGSKPATPAFDREVEPE